MQRCSAFQTPMIDRSLKLFSNNPPVAHLPPQKKEIKKRSAFLVIGPW